MRMPGRARHMPSRACFFAVKAALMLTCSDLALADRVAVTIEGIEEPILESARANLELMQYQERDVSAAEVRRLFDRGKEQIERSLEPFGYYNAQVDGRLERPEPGKFQAVYQVKVGEPVIVQQQRIEVSPDAAAQVESVQFALERFEPKHGARLDHGAYERSKEMIATALAN